MGRRRTWDPIFDLVTMQQAMDRLFEDSVERRGPGWRRGERVAALAVDVYSTADELVVQASVPGLDPDNVEITIEGETLTIKGETKPPLDNVEYHIQERHYGPFSRTLALNVPVQPEQAEAVFDKGVLTLTIPKAQESRPRVIKVRSKE
jgi:HSP20 family protein